jgi:hypothetical protein
MYFPGSGGPDCEVEMKFIDAQFPAEAKMSGHLSLQWSARYLGYLEAIFETIWRCGK